MAATRVEDTRKAWTRLVETGRLDASLVRPHVLRAWSRCVAEGADPRALRAVELSPEDTAALLERRRDLIEAARPYMQALSRAAGEDRHAAMLGDADGVVLDVVGDEASVQGPERVPGPGALLSEAVAGANGIGTPLAEDDYVELVGPEHFIEGFHVFTCQGLPLRGPKGERVGVLGVSVRRIEAAQRIREILVAAAYGVEAELRRRRLEADTARVLASGDARGEALERLRQDLVQLPAAARLRVERAARKVAQADRDEPLELLEAAEALVGAFRRRAELWADVAADELSAPSPVDLVQRVRELVELLDTERAHRSLEILLRLPEAASATVDARALTRGIFSTLLAAFESARPGERLEVRLDLEAPHPELVISVGGTERLRRPVSRNLS